jgi:NAD(P)-dependent dehydrogenase (short-subunit alcohol dehydrogenase family)
MGDGVSQTDRLALVTGTTSGIGAAVAGRLLSGGWTVIGVARRRPTIADPLYTHVELDLGETDDLEQTIADAVGPVLQAKSWSVVGLVNNAADVGALRCLDHQRAPQLLRLFGVNVVAPAWLMGFVLRASPPPSAIRIVNVSSGAAGTPFPGLGTYGASKAALRMLGMVLAAELALPESVYASRDCSIVTYEPGIVDTEMQVTARTQPRDFPLVDVFKQFKSQGQLVAPGVPAAEIVGFLESVAGERYADRALAMVT